MSLTSLNFIYEEPCIHCEKYINEIKQKIKYITMQKIKLKCWNLEFTPN